MTLTEPAVKRGRPPTISRERIADAGIKIGLPNITFVGVAEALGVTHMALYKHVASLDKLKQLVAEEIFSRWQLPQLDSANGEGLEAYLLRFTASVRVFVKAHPGLTPYVIRRLAATQTMRDKIKAHQQHIAAALQLPQAQASWALATVAFHAIAVADTLYSVTNKAPKVSPHSAAEEREMEQEFAQGMRALIVGVTAMLADGRYLDDSEFLA